MKLVKQGRKEWADAGRWPAARRDEKSIRNYKVYSSYPTEPDRKRSHRDMLMDACWLTSRFPTSDVNVEERTLDRDARTSLLLALKSTNFTPIHNESRSVPCVSIQLTLSQ